MCSSVTLRLVFVFDKLLTKLAFYMFNAEGEVFCFFRQGDQVVDGLNANSNHRLIYL